MGVRDLGIQGFRGVDVLCFRAKLKIHEPADGTARVSLFTALGHKPSNQKPKYIYALSPRFAPAFSADQITTCGFRDTF